MIYRTPLAMLGVASSIAAFSVHVEAAAATPNASPSVMSQLVVQDYALMEDKPTGTYGEPEWTHNRRFSRTRVYIQQDPWDMGFEQWYRVRTYDGGRVTQRSQTEFEIGLPYRMQLDLYDKFIYDNQVGHWEHDEFAVELRYALADWGKLPGNPTLYAEYAFTDSAPDVLETKVLFGDDFGKGWHWGFNLINEHELWGERTTEWRVAAGLSRTIIDSVFSVGIEGQWAHANDSKSEGLLGPSIQWRPTEKTHLDLVALIGLTDATPNTECWLIFGFDLGKGAKNPQGYKPTTLGGL